MALFPYRHLCLSPLFMKTAIKWNFWYAFIAVVIIMCAELLSHPAGHTAKEIGWMSLTMFAFYFLYGLFFWGLWVVGDKLFGFWE